MPPNNQVDMQDMKPFQGLRGVCAMAIFLGHQTELLVKSPWKNQDGILGLEFLQAVSLFFLLSGIPLARLYATKISTPQGCREFWIKRVARLAPIYYLTLALNWILLLLWGQDVDIAATVSSVAGCALLLQGWWVLRFISVGGVLWQVAVFAYGYAIFPAISMTIRQWRNRTILIGMGVLYLASLGLWLGVFILPSELWLMKWWVWHVHCTSRLPHIVVGVPLGELVERQRNSQSTYRTTWSWITDALSVLLVLTAIQAPIVQWYYGIEVRSNVSIGLEAVGLPLHALWLAGIVLSYQNDHDCLTRRALSWKPLVFLGDLSLVLYCLHLVVLFSYTAVYSYLTEGHWKIMLGDYSLLIQTPWYHMPFQWVLVVLVSWAVSKWFEAPMRKRIAKFAISADATTSELDAEAKGLLSGSSSKEPVYGASA